MSEKLTPSEQERHDQIAAIINLQPTRLASQHDTGAQAKTNPVSDQFDVDDDLPDQPIFRRRRLHDKVLHGWRSYGSQRSSGSI